MVTAKLPVPLLLVLKVIAGRAKPDPFAEVMVNAPKLNVPPTAAPKLIVPLPSLIVNACAPAITPLIVLLKLMFALDVSVEFAPTVTAPPKVSVPVLEVMLPFKLKVVVPVVKKFTAPNVKLFPDAV